MRVVPPLTGRLDMALSNFVKGYRQAPLVGDLLFPRLPVLRQTDKYWVFGRENQELTEQTLRAFGTSPAETRFQLSLDSYQVLSHALKARIPDEDRDTYTVGDLDTETVSLLQDKILLDREVRIRALAANPASYAGSNSLALAGTSQWSDYVNSDPLGDVEKAKRQIRLTGSSANMLLLSDDVATIVSSHPKIIERFKYTVLTGALDAAQLSTVFKVPVTIASSVEYDGVNPGFVWSNFAGLYFVSPTVGAPGVLGGIGVEGTVGPRQLSFGKSFTWTTAPGTVDGYGVIIARDPDALAKADVLGVDWYSDERVTGPDCGFLWTTPVNPAALAG